MGVMKQVIRVISLLDGGQPGQVRTPIGVRKILQIEIAVVHVSRVRQIRPHGSVDIGHIGDMGRGIGWVQPTGEILNAVLCPAASGKRGIGGGHIGNCAAVGIA